LVRGGMTKKTATKVVMEVVPGVVEVEVAVPRLRSAAW
jgi:hypothetical protein